MTELQLHETLPSLREQLNERREMGQTIALVPTMGNLHKGHLTLIAEARTKYDVVVATIFVNPMQFGPKEDLARYPRTFADDVAALKQAGCDYLYAPAVSEIYPDGSAVHTKISVPEISSLHCGQSRPGHFDGVCTVVCKLFNMIQPNAAFFGYKDYQQFHLISIMVRDLYLPVRLQGVPTVRESSGLAMSSRNGYLSPEQREQSAILYATLIKTAARIQQGEQNFRQLENEATVTLTTTDLQPDYFHICNRDTLQLAQSNDTNLVILAAVYSGTTRLIDNIFVQTAA
ncbi:MAG: pantoate--beta-alanine ligase [Pseudomonadota bacterium]